jgi:arabinan endo-1,5-alpha-L-arabinosidase
MAVTRYPYRDRKASLLNSFPARSTVDIGSESFSWLLSVSPGGMGPGDALGTRAQHRGAEGTLFRRRRTAVSSALAAFLLTGFFTAPSQATASAAAPALVINQDFADPDVLQLGSAYFAYSTTSFSGRIPVAAASAPGGPWTVRGDALGQPPSWAKPDGGFWAPDVSQRSDGSFLMYFSGALSADGRMCIGTAEATDAAGPFKPVGGQPLVCEPADSGDIDPQTFADADGTRYLLYKSNGSVTGNPSAIWLQKVSANGTQPIGRRVELLRSDLGAEQTIVEAPSIVHQQSKFVLFYAADNFLNTGYHTSYATAPSLMGAYVKSDAPILSTASLNNAVDGPGGADVVGDHVFFHGWLGGERKARGLYVASVSFADGIPTVN